MVINSTSKPNNKVCGDGKSCTTCHLKFWCRSGSDIKIELPEEELVYASKKEFQLAVDIGTTTIAAALVADGKIVATTGKINPQVKWGTDVLTRGEAAEKFGAELQTVVIDVIKEFIKTLCPTGARMTEGVITGNTMMLYLLTGRNPECLTKAPFEPDWFGDKEIELAGMKFYIPPCISAFVGADAVCGAVAVNLGDDHRTKLLADIGTNGEILLWHNGKMYCSSAAAGPAFEGFGLSYGMGASEGAVEHVTLAGNKLIYKVIGDVGARGLCGSGIIDMMACLKQTGMLEENGELTDSVKLIDNKDINMIQLAKSAVCAGIITTLEKAGVETGQVETFYIAGGFGKNLNIQNAASIGLFPFTLAGKAELTGNSALVGAALLCGNESKKEMARKLSRKAETVKLTEEEIFVKKFIECMAIKPII